MRYFKYKNVNKNRKNALKEQYNTLTKCEKRTVLNKKVWHVIYRATQIVSFSLLYGSVIALAILTPIPQTPWIETLVVVSMVIDHIAAFPLCAALAYRISLPLRARGLSDTAVMKKEILAKACKHLREYYGLTEPYLITKCYDSSNPSFRGKDVCIFVSNGELRMTVDIINGFFHGESDRGCYAFNKEEMTLAKLIKDELLICELKAGDSFFLLGYKAKGFIQTNFLLK